MKTICRLCLELLDEAVQIDENLRQMLEGIFISLDFSANEQPVACNECIGNLRKCYEFKSLCRNAQSGSEIKLEEGDSINGEALVCRFCGQSTNCKFLHEKHKDAQCTLQVHLPEINVRVGENVTSCDKCFGVVQGVHSFVTKCLDVEEKIMQYIKIEGVENHLNLMDVREFSYKCKTFSETIGKETCNSSCKDIQDVDVKTEDIGAFDLNIKIEETEVKVEDDENCESSEEAAPPSVSKPYKCSVCSFASRYKASLRYHSLMHKNISDIRIYNCELCSYQTKHRRGIKAHMVIHKGRTEVKMFKCDFCPYEAKYKSHVNRHMISHKKESEEVMTFGCQFCTYQTRIKGNLAKHVRVHKNSKEALLYKCDFCSYETNSKSYIEQHVRTHTNLRETPNFTCEVCSYQTNLERHFRRHQKIHKQPELMSEKTKPCVPERPVGGPGKVLLVVLLQKHS